MKDKKTKKRLELSKVTITTIGRQQQEAVKGGVGTDYDMCISLDVADCTIGCQPGYHTVETCTMCYGCES